MSHKLRQPEKKPPVRSRDNRDGGKGTAFPAVSPMQRKADEKAAPVQKAGGPEEELPAQGKFETVQKVEEEEPLQGKFQTVQKMGPEEEPVQGKFDTMQKVEEEEPLQGKFQTVQKMGPEEEPVQGKFDTLQKVEEEEPLQGKFRTVQKMGPEEEPLQGKFETVQKAGGDEEDPMQLRRQGKTSATTVQKKEVVPGSGGLPAQLRNGIEQLSGQSMRDVKVHYNSSKPAQLKALAYAQGSEIHIGPGQEKHLPHEAWHVAQQKQGRVQPTVQMKEGVPVNDDPSLEKEADVMGAKALQGKFTAAGMSALSSRLLTGGVAQRKVVQRNGEEAVTDTPSRSRGSNVTTETEDARYKREHAGIVNMVEHAAGVLGSVNWAGIAAKSDTVGTAATVGGLAGSLTGLSGTATTAIQGTGKSGVQQAAGDVVSSVGSSIGAVVSSVKAIKAAYNTLNGDESKFTGSTTAARELMAALKAGFEAAMSVQKYITGSVSPGIMSAIPGLGIAIAACDVLINAYNTYSASTREEEMGEVSDEFRKQLKDMLGADPETKDGLFAQEKRGKMFNRQTYLRLKPGMREVLESIRNERSDVQREKLIKNLRSKNGIPDTVSFDDLYAAIEYYELGSKMQEINQKRKVQGVRNIFTSLIEIAGQIAKFFPADGGITAGVLLGTSAAIGAAQSAAKFIQKQARNHGVLGGDSNRSEDAKHKEYVLHTRSIYQYLSGIEQPVKAKDAGKVNTGEQLLKATGVNVTTVYATDYSNDQDVQKQVKLIVETMKTGR